MSIPSRFSNTDSSDAAFVNRPDAKGFEMPLFPGYIRSKQQNANQPQVGQPKAGQHRKTVSLQDHLNRRAANTPAPESAGQQQNMYPETSELHQLRTRIMQLEQRHKREIVQLETDWQNQLEAAIALRPGSPDSLSMNSTSAMPRLSLHHVPSTYEVPKRLPLTTWLDRSLGSIPTFLLLVVAGMVLAALSAIALSPNVLWPSVSAVMQSMVPTLFVIGLFGFFATAVWNVAR